MNKINRNGDGTGPAGQGPRTGGGRGGCWRKWKKLKKELRTNLK